MIAGMLYLGVMLVAFVPVCCFIIILSAGAMVYLRFHNIGFQNFHPMKTIRKLPSEAACDLPPVYEIAITMPTGGVTGGNPDPDID